MLFSQSDIGRTPVPKYVMTLAPWNRTQGIKNVWFMYMYKLYYKSGFLYIVYMNTHQTRIIFTHKMINNILEKILCFTEYEGILVYNYHKKKF